MAEHARPLRVLFLNEGNLGSYVLGQGQLDAALQTGLQDAPDIDARFAGLAPLGRWARAAATRPIPLLAGAHLDFRTLRWHLVQAARGRAQLRRELRDWPADVAHVHSHSIALAMGSAMKALPVVLSLDATVRGWWAMPAWQLSERYASITITPSSALERRALRRSALVLAWTRWARASVESEAPGTRVVEHHPGLDLARYRPAAHRERERPRVLFVGGRFSEKGGEDLLAALAEDLGDGVDLDVVTPAAVAQRPGVRVHRLAPTDPQLLDLLQQADLLCLPTYGDACPWVLLEAMACGTPVVSTRVGGIPDMLDDGRVGVLIDYGDARALRETLSSLLGDEQQLRRLGGEARAWCEQRYDARRQFARLAEHLRALN